MALTVQYTSEQSAALATWDASVALSAGAGCGKTFVLTRRFLSHLDPGDPAPDVKLGEIVAITFTDAAARELRDRVRRECLARLTDPATSDPDQWLRLLRSLDSARISTIHSLCSRMIRSHAIELGLDPTFRVSDAPATAVMQIEVLDDVLRERLATRDDAVMRLAGDYELNGLKNMIRELLPKARLAEFAEWQQAKPEAIVMAWQAEYHRYVREQLQNLAESTHVAAILELLRDYPEAVARKPKFAHARTVLLDALPRLVEYADRLSHLEELFKAAKVGGICTPKDWDPRRENYETYSQACSGFREAIKTLFKQPLEPAEAAVAAENGLRLMQLTSAVSEAYEAAKRGQAVIDYDDLLFHARRLLTDEQFADTRRQWQQQIRMLLVDEFQDTDQVQVDIVKALVGDGLAKGGLFFVGDFKQSIYRFRGAEPSVFDALTEAVPEAGRLRLTTNFRSQGAILDFVNALFGRVFDNYDALQPKRAQVTPRPAVEFLWHEPDAPQANDPAEEQKRKIGVDELRPEEAKRIAQRLRAMIKNGEPIVAEGGQPRAVRPGDITILFRALSDVPLYEQALEAAGIDYYLVGGHAFYSQQEVFDVVNLLRALSSACDEVSLAGVLRSPFFSLADETLYWLVERHGSLNTAIAAGNPPRELEPAEQEKFSAAVITINELRQMKDATSPAVLLQTALDRTGYDAVLLAEFLGDRKLANLHKLLEQARATEQTAGGGLDAFLEQLTEFTARAPKEAPAATNPETADVVKLMSIHMAKGLEFPVVVVADLNRCLSFDAPSAVFDSELGPLVKLPNSHDQSCKVGLDIYKQLHRSEEEGEFDRLLYVACTRAADYLVFSAAVKDLDKPDGTWLKRLAEHFVLRTGDYLHATGNTPPLVTVISHDESGGKGEAKGRSRPDLLKLLAETQLLVDRGRGEVPRGVQPLPPDRGALRRFTVTRLSGKIRAYVAPRGEDDGEGPVTPGGDKWLDGRGLGSLVHAVLERARFGQTNPVGEWCELLAPLHMDENEALAATEAQKMVEDFLESSRCADLVAADCEKREIGFLLRWPLEGGTGEPTFLQGYIDCIYRDAAGAWHLLDFKTNKLAGKSVSQVAEPYRMQLAVYALAMEHALGIRPAELVLHFLRESKEHHFPWDDASRAAEINRIDQAIAAAVV